MTYKRRKAFDPVLEDKGGGKRREEKAGKVGGAYSLGCVLSFVIR